MTLSRVPNQLVAGRTTHGLFARNRYRARRRPMRVASVATAIGTLLLALAATPAHAIFLPLSHFGSQGSAAGAFATPVGVAVDQTTGDVYVADSGNARVQKFDQHGTFIAAWGWGVTDGMAQSEVCTSACLAGITGSGAGQFSNPTSIAVDSSGGSSSGDVYVGDSGNNVVLKFDTNGNYLSTIDGSTTPQGPFSFLVGVSVDQSGHLWTADGNTDNITEFDENGTFVQQWTDPFGQTLAIAVDRTNSFVYLIRGSQETERFNLTGGDETVIEANDGTQAGTALSVDPASGTLYIGHADHVTVYDTTGAQLDSLRAEHEQLAGSRVRDDRGRAVRLRRDRRRRDDLRAADGARSAHRLHRVVLRRHPDQRIAARDARAVRPRHDLHLPVRRRRRLPGQRVHRGDERAVRASRPGRGLHLRAGERRRGRSDARHDVPLPCRGDELGRNGERQ